MRLFLHQEEDDISMKRILMLAGASVALGLAAPALAQPGQPAPPTPRFIHIAAQTDAFERREGRLAQAQAADPRVRDFGAMMVRDHTRTTEALKAAIARAGLPAPPPPQLSPDEQQEIATLAALHGQAFDHAYVEQQIRTHEQALGVMQAYAAGGDNSVIRQAAAQTVPIVARHLHAARALQGAP